MKFFSMALSQQCTKRLLHEEEAMRINIAVVQFAIHQFVPEENLRKAEHFIQAAAAQHAQLIVFPEDFITGPLAGRNAYADYAGSYVKHFQKLAVQYGIEIGRASCRERV